jgi:hypothetical protein
MTLATHAVVGAAIASSMPNHPVTGFALAFASHFVLDAIPHWDYPLASHTTSTANRMNEDMIINKSFFIDLTKIGFDMLCGILFSLLLFTLHGPHLFWIPMIGVLGAVLPDALQFIYWKWRHQPLIALQKFHLWIHAKNDLNDKPAAGIPFQIALIVLVVLASKAL